MDSTVLIVLAVLGALALIAGAGVGVALIWRKTVTRYLILLIGRREGVRAGIESFASVAQRLAGASDEQLIAFALDEDHEDRKALREIAARMRIDAIELATMPLPKELVPIADDLSDAAEAVMEQAERIVGSEGPEALDALASVDLPAARRFLQAAEDAMSTLKAKYRLEDDAVYGGGLYI